MINVTSKIYNVENKLTSKKVSSFEEALLNEAKELMYESLVDSFKQGNTYHLEFNKGSNVKRYTFTSVNQLENLLELSF